MLPIWRKIAHASFKSVVPSEVLRFARSKRSNKIGLSEFELDTCTATFRHIPTYPRTERLQEILEHQQQSRRKTKSPFFPCFRKGVGRKGCGFLVGMQVSGVRKVAMLLLWGLKLTTSCTPPERLTLAESWDPEMGCLPGTPSWVKLQTVGQGPFLWKVCLWVWSMKSPRKP